MKYTLEQIHNLKDSELCEAISQAREQKPTDKPPFFDMLGESKLGAWDYSYVNHIWRPLSWLDPQNWTRLMDEVAHTALNETAREMRFSNFGLTGYPDSKGAWNGAWNCRTGKVAINADSAARAVCEAWLYLEAQKNEIM